MKVTAALVVVLSVLCCRDDAVRATTVCAIVATPRTFHQHVVRVYGQVRGDGVELTTLVDADCPGTALALVLEPSLATQNAKALRAAVADLSGTAHRDIRGSFTGRFVWHPDGRPSRTLVVSDISNLVIAARK
jgi:hypothetical protein